MSAATDLARRILDRFATAPVVVSLYLDLDPSRFATAPARASQITSLLDDARRQAAEREGQLEHGAAQALRHDLEGLDDFLDSEELPVSGARSIAVFAAGGEREVHPLAAAAGPSVAVGPDPVIEPLVSAPASPAWCATLVASDRAEIVRGSGGQVTAHEHSEDYVRGLGEGPTGHSEEQDAEGHLIKVAAGLRRDLERGRFDRLALGGPVEALSGLEAALSPELRAVLIEQRLAVDPSAASDSEIAAAVQALVADAVERDRARMLGELAERLQEARGADRPARAVAGAEAVELALTERRVATLLLGATFTGPEREAAIRSAAAQDAAVVAFDDTADELPPARPVAALLRF
jgi:peptide chain release factor subunit 1